MQMLEQTYTLNEPDEDGKSMKEFLELRLEKALDKLTPAPNLPSYLYHASNATTAQLINQSGLKALSVGGEDQPYLCMSGKLEGATTLDRKASDVIYRVSSSKLHPRLWRKSGAGKEEWRSNYGIPASLLESRRFLGTVTQKAWKPVG